MRSRANVLYACLPLLALHLGCSEDVQSCFDDTACGEGLRCVRPETGEIGVCEACAATETPYNGVDDDCKPSTRDIDLDGDGENAIDSPIRPGLDCDDTKAEVNSTAREICGDGLDNDCNGVVDDPSCGDSQLPTVTFIDPTANAVLNGQVVLRIRVTDDRSVANLDVDAMTGAGTFDVGEQEISGGDIIVEVRFDTSAVADGPVRLDAQVTDVAGKTNLTSVNVIIDNRTPPTVVFTRPNANNFYGGFVTVTATVTDPSGVDRVVVEVDGTATATLTEAPYTTVVQTSSLTDGLHELAYRAFDGNLAQTREVIALNVDNTPPFIRFAVPSGGAVLSGVVQAIVTATDASDLSAFTSGGSSGTSPLSFGFDTTVIPNGPSSLSATAVDNAIIDDVMSGNVGSATVTFTIDNIDPTPIVNFAQPMDQHGVLGPTALVATAASPVNNAIAGMEFFVDGATAGVVATAPYTLTHDFSTYTGTVSVTAVATDVMGNMGSANITVRVVDPPGFRTASNVSVPGGVATQGGFDLGDLNNDGVLDLVAGATELTVWTGTIGADGHWAAINPQPLGRETLLDVRLADLNGDAQLDAIGFAGDRVKVFMASGPGMFMPPVVVMLPQTGMAAFELGDLDGDLDLDLVVVGGRTAGIVGYTYLLDASGNFVRGQDLGGDSGCSDVALGDIDADGDTDVVVGRSTTAVVSIFRNGGTANFGAGLDTNTAAGPTLAVAIGDVTGEGRLDVVATQPNGYQILPVLSTNPFQIIAAQPTVAAGVASDIAIANVVGNNTADVIVANRNTHGFRVHRSGAGGATGMVEDQNYIVSNGFSRLTLVDLDGDADLDIMGMSYSDDTISWVRNINTGKFVAGIFFDTPITQTQGGPAQLVPRAIDTGNIIGTPASDIVVTYTAPQAPPQFAIYERTGPTDLTPPAGAPLPGTITTPSVLAVGGRSAANNELIVVATSGTPSGTNATAAIVTIDTRANPPTVNTIPLLVDTARDIKFGDVDNDTVEEIIFAVDPAGTANDGSFVVEPDVSAIRGPFNIGSGAGSLAISNLDNDPSGWLDYAVSNTGSENITVMAWNGSALINTQYNAPTGLGAITTGFVNNDPFVDIVGVAGGNVVFVMEGDPNFGFRTPVTYQAGQQPTRITGGDFNGDGLFDLMTIVAGDKASLLIARPQGGFFPPIPYSLGASPVDFRTEDFDGDGNLDVIAINAFVPSIMMIYNNAPTLP